MEFLMPFIGLILGDLITFLFLKLRGAKRNADQERQIDQLTYQLQNAASAETLAQKASQRD